MPMLFEALMNHLQNVETTVSNRGIDAVDVPLVLRIATEFAPRTTVVPGGFRWWADALAFDTYGRARATYTLAGIARDADVPYARLANLAPSDEDGQRACDVIALKRDAALGAVFRHAERHYRQLADELKSIPEAAASVLASAELCAQAAGPLTYQRERERSLVAVRSSFVADVICAGCRYQWRPRVAQPRKCPMCQRHLNWNVEEETPIAQGSEPELAPAAGAGDAREALDGARPG